MSLTTSQLRNVLDYLNEEPKNSFFLFIYHLNSLDYQECHKVIDSYEFKNFFNIFTHIGSSFKNIYSSLTYDIIIHIQEKNNNFIDYLINNYFKYLPIFDNELFLKLFDLETVINKNRYIEQCINYRVNNFVILELCKKHINNNPDYIERIVEFLTQHVQRNSVFNLVIDAVAHKIKNINTIDRILNHCMRFKLNDLFIKVVDRTKYDLSINNNRIITNVLQMHNPILVKYISSKIKFTKKEVQVIYHEIEPYLKENLVNDDEIGIDEWDDDFVDHEENETETDHDEDESPKTTDEIFGILIKNHSFLNNLPEKVKKKFEPNYKPKILI